MAIVSPFIRVNSSEWDDEFGNSGFVFSFVTADGTLEEVSYSVCERAERPTFWASEFFVDKYGDTLPLGDVLTWTLESDMNTWLSKLIYASFLKTSAGGPICWFLKVFFSRTIDSRLFMPMDTINAYGDHMNDTWVILKYGSRTWPIHIVDNHLDDGWLAFCDDHNLSAGMRIIFGTERRSIFNVIILNQHLERATYEWAFEYHEFDVPRIGLNPTGITWLPSLICRDGYIAEFGHVCNSEYQDMQVFHRRLAAFLRNDDVQEIDFCTGKDTWTVPKVNGRLHSPRLRVFFNALQLELMNFLYVAVYDPSDARVLVFNSDGVGRVYL